MDIGTAKPARAELARVPHHLIDSCGVSEPMDITRYVDLAKKAVADIFRRGRRVLVAGGSGFYLKSFFAPVADAIAVPAELREELRQRLERDGLEDLLDELRRMNPAGVGSLDVQNPRRVIRALERCRASGRTLMELKDAFAAQVPPFAGHEVRLCELIREKGELDRRIARRVDDMIRAGLADEVRRLLANGLKDNPSAARAIGYRETIEVAEGRAPVEELAERITQNTRALVKKQRTWFKTQLPEHRRLDAAAATEATLFG